MLVGAYIDALRERPDPGVSPGGRPPTAVRTAISPISACSIAAELLAVDFHGAGARAAEACGSRTSALVTRDSRPTSTRTTRRSPRSSPQPARRRPPPPTSTSRIRREPSPSERSILALRATSSSAMLVGAYVDALENVQTPRRTARRWRRSSRTRRSIRARSPRSQGKPLIEKPFPATGPHRPRVQLPRPVRELMAKQLYTASEAAAALGISLDTLRRWDKRGPHPVDARREQPPRRRRGGDRPAARRRRQRAPQRAQPLPRDRDRREGRRADGAGRDRRHGAGAARRRSSRATQSRSSG